MSEKPEWLCDCVDITPELEDRLLWRFAQPHTPLDPLFGEYSPHQLCHVALKLQADGFLTGVGFDRALYDTRLTPAGRERGANLEPQR